MALPSLHLFGPLNLTGPPSLVPRWAPGLCALCFLIFLSGCFGQRRTIREQASLIDSLQVRNETLSDRVQTYADSLQFIDDVETGRYYRELRVLNDRLARARYDITTLRDNGRTVQILLADELFEPASALLTQAGRTQLDTLSVQLRAAYPDRHLLVEGHSDNLALGPELQEQYPSNWELSAARASTVVRYLIETYAMERSRFTVLAFADTRPVASNRSAEGRRANRRVRVAVMPVPRDYASPHEAAW